ncbi:25S rRNA (adenine2142-N1)-methyltransferase [Recurvomyces mirabilis]|nr:25S rRNA (adenine2142-N1)-methyltransferase [Recurvomyces mirabilis]
MYTSTIATVATFTLGAAAAPWGHFGWGGWNGWGFNGGSGECMNDAQAQQVANNFKGLISAYTNDLANAVLTTDVQDFSDSVIELIDGGCPSSSPGPAPYIALGSPTFTSLATFEAGQGGQPNITFNILNVWHNCDTVTVRWRGPLPNPGPIPPPPAVQEQVTGIIVLETSFNGWQSAQQFLIQTIYSEFNSGAWLYDLGIFTPAGCSGSARRDAVAQALPAGMGMVKRS